MSNYAEQMFSHANVEVPLDRIKPTGDCVLIRVLPEDEVTASGIVLPQTGKDSSELRIGEVVAVGPGDKRQEWLCGSCFTCEYSTRKGAPKCPGCQKEMTLGGYERHPMHVKPGDRIWYRRVLANQQLINGELYQLIHEEAHIWAVLEN